MNQHVKTFEFGSDTTEATSPLATAEEAVRQVADTVSDAASSAAETAKSEADDLVAWAKKAIDENPGTAVAGAVAVGAVLALVMMSKRKPEDSIARLRQQAMDYSDRLERRARRELKRMDADKAYQGVSEFVSSYGSQIGGLMSGLMSHAQEFVDQARKSARS